MPRKTVDFSSHISLMKKAREEYGIRFNVANLMIFDASKYFKKKGYKVYNRDLQTFCQGWLHGRGIK